MFLYESYKSHKRIVLSKLPDITILSLLEIQTDHILLWCHPIILLCDGFSKSQNLTVLS